MLTSSQRIVTYDFARRLARPDRLHRGRHTRYLRAASRMIGIYRRGAGTPRGDLHRRVERVLESLDDCPPRRIAAFCKLLDDASRFAADARQAAKLRRQVFSIAAASHPLVTRPEGIFESTLEQAHLRVAAELGRPWQEIEANLFADVIELQRMETFAPFQPAELLAAYNVAQTQTLLYRASRVTVWACEDMKTILRHAKLAGLMHEIHRLDDGGGYRFTFDGPASALRSTSRYGVRFARMIPKLLSCRQWRLHASIIGPRQHLFDFHLSPADGLRSALAAPDPFDSALEADIVERWNAATPEGWRLEREGEILHVGQIVCTPDFVLRRAGDPDPIYVELVGYWTPEYLRDKARRLSQLASHRWILVIPKTNSAFGQEIQLPTLPLKGKFSPDALIQLADQHYPPSTT